MKLTLFLVSIVSASAFRSERLTMINKIRKDPTLSAEQVFDFIIADFPETSWTVHQVAFEIEHILRPIEVPDWFHQLLWVNPQIEAVLDLTHISDPVFPAIYESEETRKMIAHVWLNHCVTPSLLFPDTPWCFPTTIQKDGMLMPGWRLTPERIELYLTEVSIAEADHDPFDFFFSPEFTDSLFPEKTEVTTPPAEEFEESVVDSQPSGLKRKRSRLDTAIEKLISDVESNMALVIAELRDIASGRPNGSASRVRLLTGLMKPGWFHAALVSFPGPRCPKNRDLQSKLKFWGGIYYENKFVSQIQDWDRWCLQALRKWSEEGITDTEPPCGLVQFEEAAPSDWFVLSQSQMIQYLLSQVE